MKRKETRDGRRTCLAIVLIAGAFLCPAEAQTAQTPLKGTVLDSSRAPIAGAQVIAISAGRNSGPSAVSDQNGEFSLPLEAGTYTVKVAKEGFVEALQTVNLPKSGSQEFVLQVAPVQGAVTITDSAGYLTPTTSSASYATFRNRSQLGHRNRSRIR